MQIISCENINLLQYGYGEHPCVWAIHIQINHNDFTEEGLTLVQSIQDESWLSKLDIVDQVTYEARMRPTIELLSQSIISTSEISTLDDVKGDFAEYLISINAQNALVQKGHTSIPLAEIWKEKIKNNPGFDFHTISPNTLFVFGEAKYAANNSSPSRAILQIAEFLLRRKHTKELSDLRTLSQSQEAAIKATQEQIGIAAAFSVRQVNVQSMINNAIYHSRFKELLTRQEIYIIAVEII